MTVEDHMHEAELNATHADSAQEIGWKTSYAQVAQANAQIAIAQLLYDLLSVFEDIRGDKEKK